jgi:hypothetical protein
MDGFEYVRNPNEMYKPRTPAAALRALERGMLPPEAFVYRAGSVKPLFEQPADLDEIQRLLAKPNLDLDTTLLVLDILYEMLDDADPERALFAAESINGIENRYMERLEKLLEAGDDPEELVRLYYELARTHVRRQTLRSFYLQEALKWVGEARKQAAISPELDELHAKLLIELERYDEAHEVLKATGELARSLNQLLLLAELEFRKRDFVRVISIFQYMESQGLVVGDLVEELAAQWGQE